MSGVSSNRLCFGGICDGARDAGAHFAGRICGAGGQKLPPRRRV